MGGVVDALKDIVDDVVSFVGRPFGIHTHNETFTDLQISNLLTPDEADKSARKNAKYHAKGNAMRYFNSYRSFQRDYRKKYSAQFMERQGYAPNSTATATIAVESKVETYLETLYGYVDVNVESFGDRFLTLNEKGLHAVQQIAGYDFPTGLIIISGKTYNNHQYVELIDDTQLEVTSTRLYDETIIQNLTDNYGYDGTYIYIGDNKYLVGAISNVININDEYETVCTHIPHQYADISASGLVNGTDACTISYPDDVDVDGYVEDYEITGGIVNVLVTLPVTAILGDSLDVTIDGNVTNYIVTQDMIDNGLNIAYSGYTLINMPTLPNEVILTSVERIVNVITEPAYGTEASYASYRVTSGEVGTELRYWVDVANTQDIYDSTILDITAIIPMKEDNVMVDTDAYKLNRMLRKLNLSGDQLRDSIENPDLDSAYLMMGINPEYDDAVTNEVMFKMFDFISPGSGDIDISISQLNMNYKFTMAKSTINGSIGAPGTYTRTQTGTSGEVIMTLRFQGDTNEYQELIISNFAQKYTVSGNNFTAYLDSTGGYCRLAIPLDLLNSLPYKKFVWIYERSLCMLAYATETVEVKWYETAAFGSLLKIVGLVLTIMSWGTTSSLYAVIVKVAQTVAIAMIVSYIAQQIGGILGAIIGIAVGMLLTGTFTDFNISLSDPEIWLKLANQFLNTMGQMQQHELESFMTKSQAELDELAKQTEELQEKMEEFEDPIKRFIPTFNSAYAGTPNNIYQTTEQYHDGIIEASVEYIVQYDLQIQSSINTRTTVWTGP